MSRISIQGDSSGTGTLTIQAPNTNSNYTLTLPTNTGTVMTSASNTFAGGLTLGGDLTLDSNGIYLGGTGAANYLDDYEEGTWTPVIEGTSTAGTASYSTRQARYTKVGRSVFVETYIAYSGGTGTGVLSVNGLPFTSSNSDTFPSCAIGYFDNVTLTASNIPMAYVNNNQTKIIFTQMPVGGGTMASIAYDAAGGIQLSASYTV